jgi:hypothetical protein
MIAVLLLIIISILVAAFFPGLISAIAVALVFILPLAIFGLPTSGALIFSILFGGIVTALIIFAVAWPDIKRSREQKRRSALHPPLVIPASDVIPTLWSLFQSGKLTQKTFDQYHSLFPEADPSEKIYYATFTDPERPPGEDGFITYAIRDGLAVFVYPSDEHIEKGIYTRTIKPNEFCVSPPSSIATAAY